MDGKILVVGAAILDVLAEPVDERVFETGSSPADAITMRAGGDALNEATVLAKLGESVQLLTVLGSDPASELIRAHCRKWGIGLDHARTEAGVDTGINVVLVKEGGERSFLTNPHGTLRSLSAEHLEGDYLQGVKILCFASIFVFPKLGGRETARLFPASGVWIPQEPVTVLRQDLCTPCHRTWICGQQRHMPTSAADWQCRSWGQQKGSIILFR